MSPKSYVRQQKIHVATRSFQAFRIMLNRELESLKDALNNLFPYLRPGVESWLSVFILWKIEL